MSKEIERKFLVNSSIYKEMVSPEFYNQGYISTERGRTVRVRIQGETARLTIKGPSQGIMRDEFEYVIPTDEARYMLEHLCIQPTISKYRYKIPYKGFIWEVDEFLGDNQGLVVAEIELPSPDTSFEKPEWIGKEVSGDTRYFNSFLVRNPYKNWLK